VQTFNDLPKILKPAVNCDALEMHVGINEVMEFVNFVDNPQSGQPFMGFNPIIMTAREQENLIDLALHPLE